MGGSLRPDISPSCMVALEAGTDVVTVAAAGTPVEVVDSQFVEIHKTTDPSSFFSYDVDTGRVKLLKKFKRVKVTIHGEGQLTAAADIMIIEAGVNGAVAGNVKKRLAADAADYDANFCLVDILSDLSKDDEISVMVDAAANGDEVTLTNLALIIEVLELGAAG
jgi:hypothetical protein